MKNEKEEIVYHYCTLEGFLSIIQNSSIWMSDISKSNDCLESIYIRNKIKNRIRCELEGEAIGEARGKVEMIKSMIKEGLSIETIARISKLSVDEIEKIVK